MFIGLTPWMRTCFINRHHIEIDYLLTTKKKKYDNIIMKVSHVFADSISLCHVKSPRFKSKSPCFNAMPACFMLKHAQNRQQPRDCPEKMGS